MIFLLLDEKPLEGVYAMSIRSIFILIYLMMSLIGVVVLGGCTAVAPLTGATQSQLQPGAEADKGPSGETTDRQAEVAAPSVQPAQDLSTTVNMPIVGAIWTANEQGNSLTVVDAATNAVVATLTGIPGPHNIQISPDGQTAWAVSGHEGLAVAVSAQDFTLLGSAPVGNAPAHIIISPDGATAYVSNSGDNTVTVLDTATFTTRATIPTGAFPHGLRASPDGQWVAVANLRDDTVSLIDTATLSVAATVAVGAGPVQVAFAPDGSTLYVTLNDENAVAAVDLATQSIIGKATVGKGPVQVYVTPDGSLILVANQGSAETPGTTLSFVDAASLTEVGAIETGQGAHGVVVEPSGHYAYITNLFSHTLTTVNLADRTVVATTPTGTSPNGVSFSPIILNSDPAMEVILSLPTHEQMETDGEAEGHDAHH
jgi:YVTN family beta-propeller protein